MRKVDLKELQRTFIFTIVVESTSNIIAINLRTTNWFLTDSFSTRFEEEPRSSLVETGDTVRHLPPPVSLGLASQ